MFSLQICANVVMYLYRKFDESIRDEPNTYPNQQPHAYTVNTNIHEYLKKDVEETEIENNKQP